MPRTRDFLARAPGSLVAFGIYVRASQNCHDDDDDDCNEEW